MSYARRMGDARLHDDHEIPEFEVEARDGVLVARHRASGETVTARTWERLAGEAAALRIAISLRGGPPRRPDAVVESARRALRRARQAS